ncbi:MAG: ABC transporter permease [Gemmatimonadaceae bacterium]|jgi:putative ABC transport system permease protein|nr:ABC transporter permease [Gemmatimonadaceae bacterium]
MLWGEVLRVALSALRANKLRSLLTMLGIVIGVGAVIAMDGIGRGAQKAINDRITALGTTLLTVNPGQVAARGVASETDRARLRIRDAEALLAQAKISKAIQPEMNRQFQLQYLSRNTSTQIVGTTANYLEVRKYELEYGRMFTTREDEGKQRVAVIGPNVIEKLGVENPASLLDQPVRIRGIQFTVVGILKSKGQTTPWQNPDDQVLIPLQTARFRLMGTDRLRSISVLAPSEDSIPQTMAEIQKVLRREHRLTRETADDFEIRNQADFLNTAAETSKVFSTLLAGIAAVSLLVGGIGIMNIMLVSVTERTREIGVRKALGATGPNILLQFLIEAVVLCLLGGLIGILLGGGGALLLGNAFNWNTELSMQSVLMAFAFSATVGVLFGVWPARRAAKLDPIVALRYE